MSCLVFACFKKFKKYATLKHVPKVLFVIYEKDMQTSNQGSKLNSKLAQNLVHRVLKHTHFYRIREEGGSGRPPPPFI